MHIHDDTVSIELPDDIIVDILLKLPVKSLMRFTCVCKSWKKLISDPEFAKYHLSNSTMNHQHQQLFSSNLNNTGDSWNIISFPTKPLFENPSSPTRVVSYMMGHNYDIIGSYNGLLCLYDIDFHYVKLWNPSTRLKSKRSPVIFAFDNPMHFTCCGFGHDQVNDKYKALLETIKLDLNGFSIETVTKIYTFGTNCLTTIQNFPNHLGKALGKYVRGTLNWVSKPNRDKKWVIHSFDLVKETHGEVLLPEQDDYDDNILDPVLDVLRNCLCVCFHTKETEGVVWLMKEYGVVESWTMLMVIPRPKSWNRTWVTSFHPLCILENGAILVHCWCDTKLVLFDPNCGTTDCPMILSSMEIDHHIYHESLVSPRW